MQARSVWFLRRLPMLHSCNENNQALDSSWREADPLLSEAFPKKPGSPEDPVPTDDQVNREVVSRMEPSPSLEPPVTGEIKECKICQMLAEQRAAEKEATGSPQFDGPESEATTGH